MRITQDNECKRALYRAALLYPPGYSTPLLRCLQYRQKDLIRFLLFFFLLYWKHSYENQILRTQPREVCKINMPGLVYLFPPLKKGKGVHFPSYIISKTQVHFLQLLAKANFQITLETIMVTSNFQENNLIYLICLHDIEFVTSKNPTIIASFHAWPWQQAYFYPQFYIWSDGLRKAKQHVQSHSWYLGQAWIPTHPYESKTSILYTTSQLPPNESLRQL